MPIYDYACTRCGRVVEVVHGVQGHGPQACETCGGPMKKLLSTPTVHFKGSGWAKKDRGASAQTKAAAKAAAGGGSSDTPSEKTSPGSETSTHGSSGSDTAGPAPASTSDPS